MEIELLRGPADGAVVMVPDNTKLWVASGAMFGRVDEPPADDEPATHAEYCYAHTRKMSARGAWIFEYVGERVVQ